jgi:hypothetical protein
MRNRMGRSWRLRVLWRGNAGILKAQGATSSFLRLIGQWIFLGDGTAGFELQIAAEIWTRSRTSLSESWSA